MATEVEAPRYRIGIAGWSYEDWRGWFYPGGMRGGQLAYVARYFDLAEINSSFYRPPTPRDSEGWVEKVKEFPQFRFTTKLWQRFTHDRETAWTPAEMMVYREGVRPLADAGRLSGILAQFPWSFINVAENRDWLARLADELSDHPLFLEFRHASWNHSATYEWLKTRGVGFVNIDQPVLRNCLRPSSVVTSRDGYFRLHGRHADAWFARDRPAYERYNYLYNDDELGEIVSHIRKIAEEARTTLVITNNHYRGQAPTNALQLRHALQEEQPLAPQVLVNRYPQLRKITQPEPPVQDESQPTLF